MTIWILALLLLAGTAAVGYTQGAIRAAFSFVGIVVAALLALTLGKMIRPLLPPLGLQNPILIWALGPIIAFIVVLVLFKIAGTLVHKKADVYYKYKAGDLRLALYQRLNQRLGACVGLMNGTAYTLLIAFLIFPLSYFTGQLYTREEDPLLVRWLNRAGNDLQSTGLARAVLANNPVPEDFYRGTDLIALLYHNPLTHGRLPLYPPYLRLGERAEFQRLGEDPYGALFLTKESFGTVLNDERTRAFWSNPALFAEVWAMVEPDLGDLDQFIRTGKSAKYDPEGILGRWGFEVNGSLVALKRSKPDLSTTQFKLIKTYLYPLLAKATLVATPDGKVTLNGLVRFTGKVATAAGAPAPAAAEAPMTAGGNASAKLGRFGSRTGLGPRYQPQAPGPAGAAPAAAPTALAPGVETINLEGQWKKQGSGYELSFDTLNMEASLGGIRLTIRSEPTPLVFERDTP
jgi:hypothetical protein